MANIEFNYLNVEAFDNFVPEATKEASNELFKNVLIIGGIALVLWLVVKIKVETDLKLKEEVI